MTRYGKYCLAIALLAVAFAIPAGADQSGNATLAPNTFLNLDTGIVSSSDGDTLWDGRALLPQGYFGSGGRERSTGH